ncbi:hypothetical protein ACJ41O_010272 [Fusarium nematophilum]
MDNSTTPTEDMPETPEQEFFDAESDTLDADESNQDYQLIRLVRTAAGSELFVNSIAQELLHVGEANWGALLSAAPDALGRLGQCFVLASDPLASSLVFPDSAGLPYKSLKTNLVHCSDLGRQAFRDAEARMKQVSRIAQAVCEPGGTIDMVLEAVEDEDLVELDLPDQLDALKRASNYCISHTVAIKEKVDAWRQFSTLVYHACVDQDEALDFQVNDLDGQVDDKKLAVRMKQDLLKGVEAQTAEYRRQFEDRREELAKASKSQSRGPWTDFGVAAGEAIVRSFRILVNPIDGFNLNLGFGTSPEQHQQQGQQPCYVPETRDQIRHQEAGYSLADQLLIFVQRLLTLLTTGPEHLHGVHWEGLAGRVDRNDGISRVRNAIRNTLNGFSSENSAVTRQVRIAIEPVENIASTIRDILEEERNVSRDTEKIVAECAAEWRREVRRAEATLISIVEDGVRLETQRDTEREVMAQQELFDAETRLNKRLEEEMKATEEFNVMQANLQELLTSTVTLSHVKTVVGECVMHLQAFCDKLDQLTSFFTYVQHYVEDIDKYRVDPYSTGAKTALEMKRRADAQTSESAKLRQEKVAQRKLEQLKIKALELKGHYLVAQAMANTYTEVSFRHIIPAVESIDRLSLPSAKNLSKEERAQKIIDVGHLATRARREVKQLANARRDQFILAMSDNRGEIEDAEHGEPSQSDV